MPDGHPALLVGTTKVAFLIVGKVDRDDRAAKAPFRDGWPINHVVGDPEMGRLWAGGGGNWNCLSVDVRDIPTSPRDRVVEIAV